MNTMNGMKRLYPIGLIFAAALLIAAPAHADCDSFPKVPWWGELNHDKVASYVAYKHEGKWNPYITKWSKQVDRLKDVHKRESAVYVNYKNKKVKIAGNALANYIKLVEKRVDITRCLAQNDKYANFATAAGDKPKTGKQ
ncbi:MAG: hypothetical protein RIB59_12115 [Rhodospirillales bacterium]